MIPNKAFMRRPSFTLINLASAMLLISGTTLIAQSDFDSIGTSIIDNKIQSRLNVPPKVQKEMNAFMAPDVNKEDQPLFLTKNVNLSYGYNSKRSKLADQMRTDGHTFTPVVFLDSPKLGLSLQPSFSYVRTDGDNPKGVEVGSDAYEGKLAAAYNIGRLLRLADEKSDWSLTLVANGGYRFTDADSKNAVGVTTVTETDNYFVGGGLSIGYILARGDENNARRGRTTISSVVATTWLVLALVSWALERISGGFFRL